MDDIGDRSSPTGSGAGLLLPLFGTSSASAAESLEERLRRVSQENRRLTGALDAILADRPHLLRAALAATTEDDAVTAEPPKVRTVRAGPSDTDLVKDGYQWRKYGQKVTRDNPYPRAYFRCAYAPSCPVKKKVQRSAEDSSVLVAQYEGEHNHAQPGEFVVSDASTSQPPGTITLGLTNQGPGSNEETVPPEFRKVLVDELVNFLKNDSEFMESLTGAVTERMMEKISNRIF